MKRLPIPATSLRATVEQALESCSSMCLDTEEERGLVASAVIDALFARPEAQALRSAFAAAPTQVGKLVVMREAGGWTEGELLGAAARLAGDER